MLCHGDLDEGLNVEAEFVGVEPGGVVMDIARRFQGLTAAACLAGREVEVVSQFGRRGLAVALQGLKKPAVGVVKCHA